MHFFISILEQLTQLTELLRLENTKTPQF